MHPTAERQNIFFAIIMNIKTSSSTIKYIPVFLMVELHLTKSPKIFQVHFKWFLGLGIELYWCIDYVISSISAVFSKSHQVFQFRLIQIDLKAFLSKLSLRNPIQSIILDFLTAMSPLFEDLVSSETSAARFNLGWDLNFVKKDL